MYLSSCALARLNQMSYILIAPTYGISRFQITEESLWRNISFLIIVNLEIYYI